jgi:hypothetical protein
LCTRCAKRIPFDCCATCTVDARDLRLLEACGRSHRICPPTVQVRTGTALVHWTAHRPVSHRSRGSQAEPDPGESWAAPVGTVDSFVASLRLEHPHPGSPAGKPSVLRAFRRVLVRRDEQGFGHGGRSPHLDGQQPDIHIRPDNGTREQTRPPRRPGPRAEGGRAGGPRSDPSLGRRRQRTRQRCRRPGVQLR